MRKGSEGALSERASEYDWLLFWGITWNTHTHTRRHCCVRIRYGSLHSTEMCLNLWLHQDNYLAAITCHRFNELCARRRRRSIIKEMQSMLFTTDIIIIVWVSSTQPCLVVLCHHHHHHHTYSMFVFPPRHHHHHHHRQQQHNILLTIIRRQHRHYARHFVCRRLPFSSSCSQNFHQLCTSLWFHSHSVRKETIFRHRREREAPTTCFHLCLLQRSKFTFLGRAPPPPSSITTNSVSTNNKPASRMQRLAVCILSPNVTTRHETISAELMEFADKR